MSKITNDGLTRSGTECFVHVGHMATVGMKGLTAFINCDRQTLPSTLYRRSS